MSLPDWHEEPISKSHDRKSFDCGEASMNEFFQRFARQSHESGAAKTFLTVESVHSMSILGFYSLSAFTLAIEDVPEVVARKLPRYDVIPAALIGRLARDERARGRGVGELLLADAVRRILSAGRSLAVFAIIVDAKDERALAFYESFGFQPFPARPRRLFLPTSTAAQAFTHASK